MSVIKPYDHAALARICNSAANRVAGVDEAGRGPLAGPVVAAAVILNPDAPIDGLDDSKKLTPAKREQLADIIRECAIAWSVASASVAEIDEINILQATLLAMRRAVSGLPHAPSVVLVDGNRAPAVACDVYTIVKGDAWVPSISAASILAKVDRDRLMVQLDAAYPQYGFARHKGYPTAAHLEALSREGITPAHRRSYAPVKKYL